MGSGPSWLGLGKLLALSLLALWGCATTEVRCGLRELPIERRDLADSEHYVSRARGFVLEHWNSGRRDPPRLFPEPLVLVRADGGRCELDTGIYTRVWVSADGLTLAVDWNGGSETYFELWDVETCAVRDRFPVFGSSYRVTPDRLEDDGSCEPFGVGRGICEPAAIWELDARCRPRKLDRTAAESRFIRWDPARASERRAPSSSRASAC